MNHGMASGEMRHYKFTFAAAKIGDGSVQVGKNTFVLLYCPVWEILQEKLSRKAMPSGRGTFRSENKKAHLCRNDGDFVREKSPVQRLAVCHENRTARGRHQPGRQKNPVPVQPNGPSGLRKAVPSGLTGRQLLLQVLLTVKNRLKATI